MQYKRIVLEVLYQNPQIYYRLRCTRELLRTLRLFGLKLKFRHEFWKTKLSHSIPGSDKSQIAGEALEYALLELKDLLALMFPPEEENEPVPVEGLKAFIIAHMRHG